MGAELNPQFYMYDDETRHKVCLWAGQYVYGGHSSQKATRAPEGHARALTSSQTHPAVPSGTLGTTRRGWRSCLPLWPLFPSHAHDDASLAIGEA